MNNVLKCAIAFSIGAAVGAAISWGYLKPKYEELNRRDLESMKTYYQKKYGSVPVENETEPDETPEELEENTDTEQYKDIITESGYADGEREATDVDKPYTITIEEYGELCDYNMMELKYYSDGVLTDDWDEPIDDVEHTVGTDFQNHFDDYEGDAVYVRNDARKCDYEIFFEDGKFSDIELEKLNE